MHYLFARMNYLRISNPPLRRDPRLALRDLPPLRRWRRPAFIEYLDIWFIVYCGYKMCEEKKNIKCAFLFVWGITNYRDCPPRQIHLWDDEIRDQPCETCETCHPWRGGGVPPSLCNEPFDCLIDWLCGYKLCEEIIKMCIFFCLSVP